MGYFPFFVELTGKRGLIVGGGRVALRKAEKLLPYGPALTAAAPAFLPELEAMSGVTLLRQAFSPELLEGMYFVIAATDDRPVNREIGALCRERGILFNAADDRESCTFLFPALVRDGPLSVGISTGGSSPSGAVWVKEQLAGLLPQNFGALLAHLEALRPEVRGAVPDPGAREAVFTRLFAACLAAERPLSREEIQAILDHALAE